ncbi:MFS domain-containing protein [Aphelenchoides fujianensis]|nr:MFS domain-containing protein [Aphelenchoides fujianensis]
MASSQLLVCYGLLVLFNACFFVALSALPYVAKGVGMADLELGYAQTAFNVLQLIGTPLVGVLVDRIGFRATIAATFVSMGLSSAVLYNAESAWSIAFSQLFGVMMVAQQSIQTAVAQLTKPGSERTNAFSRLGLCFGAGFVLTPIIAKAATMAGGERTPLAAVALISFGVLPFIFAFAENSKNPAEGSTADKTESIKQKASSESGWKLVLKDEKIRQLFVLKILLLSPAMLIFGSLQIFLMNKFAVDQATNALVQLDIGLSIVFSNSFGIALLRRRFNEEELLYVGALTSIFCFAQFLWLEYLAQVWVGLFCLIFATTIATSSADSLLSSSVQHEEQGLVLGISNSAISVVRTSAPTFALWAVEEFGYGALGWVGIFAALAAIAYLRIAPMVAESRPLRSKEL